MNGSKLVFSGYSSTNNVTQAAITRDAAIGLGIPEDDIFILEKPSTTEEEALEYTSAFGNKKATLILVTSDIHMPRSMYLFRKMVWIQ
ncbi:MAG: YdcF family protein [Saprospiraceae bacterium]|nr:YdcF family protein [Saprospiraceae bacterium]